MVSIGEAAVSPNDPNVLTSKFASQAAIFALQNGWEPTEQKPMIYFEYANGEFALSKDE